MTKSYASNQLGSTIEQCVPRNYHHYFGDHSAEPFRWWHLTDNDEGVESAVAAVIMGGEMLAHLPGVGEFESDLWSRVAIQCRRLVRVPLLEQVADYVDQPAVIEGGQSIAWQELVAVYGSGNLPGSLTLDELKTLAEQLPGYLKERFSK